MLFRGGELFGITVPLVKVLSSTGRKGHLFDLCLFGFVGFLFLLVSAKGCGL